MSDFLTRITEMPVGVIVLSVIMIPVIVMAIAGVTTKPRNYAVPALFTSVVVFLIGGMVAGFAIIGFVLKFVVPQ